MLASLQQLMLNGNALTSLPDEIGALNKLGNRKSVFQNNYNDFVFIEKLDIANNRLRALPVKLNISFQHFFFF